MADETVPVAAETQRPPGPASGPPPHRTLGQLLTDLEDGQFSLVVTEALEDLIGTMENVAAETGGKVRGGLTIKLDLVRDGRMFDVKGDFTVNAPKMPRQRTPFFATEKNQLTRQDPKQHTFGFRDVSAPRDVRNI